jgi:hypothetical protein
MLEEPIKDQVVLLQSIGEEERRTREDQDEPESEEEQRNWVLLTLEQLEVLLKMNRPDFNELVATLKRGSSKNANTNRPNLGTLMVPATEKLWMLGLRKWRIIYMPSRLDGIWPWSSFNLT